MEITGPGRGEIQRFENGEGRSREALSMSSRGGGSQPKASEEKQLKGMSAHPAATG